MSNIEQLIKIVKNKNKIIVTFKKKCIAFDIPNEDIQIASGHKVNINNKINKAIHFVNNSNIISSRKKCDLYTIVLTNENDFYYANNLLVKSHNKTYGSNYIYLINNL
jgi:hypothetical protein